MEEAKRYRDPGAVPAFIWGIGIRRLIDTLRREGATPGCPGCHGGGPTDADIVQSAEDEVLLGTEYGRLGEALAQLSPELRAAIQATVLDGLTCAQAGMLLGVPAGTVKSRCHRARIELRGALT